ALAVVAALSAADGARKNPARQMTAFSLTFAALFGAVIGSFLNVCIYRVPRGRSIAGPGSSCPHCGRPLSWSENIPIVSSVALGGRCASCKGPISIRYPIVEALTAAMFATGWWYYGPG